MLCGIKLFRVNVSYKLIKAKSGLATTAKRGHKDHYGPRRLRRNSVDIFSLWSLCFLRVRCDPCKEQSRKQHASFIAKNELNLEPL